MCSHSHLTRYGFCQDSSSRGLLFALIFAAIAGAVIGYIAALAGLIALEIHWPILTIQHVAIWHSAVRGGRGFARACRGRAENPIRC